MPGTKPRKLSVDLTGVEGKKGGRRIPEGDYLFKIKDYEVGEKKDDSSKKWMRVALDIEKGPTDGEFSEMFGLAQNQLWRFRAFLEAVGFTKLKSGINNIPLDKLPGRRFAGTVADDEYNGKIKSQIQDFFSAKDFENLGTADTPDDEDEAEDEDEDDVADAATDDDEDEDDDELEVVDDDI